MKQAIKGAAQLIGAASFISLVIGLIFHRYNARLATDKEFTHHVFYEVHNYKVGDTIWLDYDVNRPIQPYHTGGWYVIFDKY